jgi:hypothetical protein
MNVEYLHEPELEFGTGRHIDIKFGLMNYGPLDFESAVAPKKIKLGIVGTRETIDGVVKWFEKCRTGIAAKLSRRPNLFPRFPGFGEDMQLCTDFVFDSQLHRPIPPDYFTELCQKPRTDQTIQEIADLFLSEMEYLAQKTSAEVFICAYPSVLVDFLDKNENEVISDDTQSDDEEQGIQTISSKFILHDYLKAHAMRLRRPTQIIRPSTYDERKRKKTRTGEQRQLQDEATRAWNLYIALYYKAGGTPWRLLRDPSQLSTCYIGMSFYRSLDQTKLLTSTAQVFNERGEGLITRGGPAQITKDDRQVHLSAEDAYNLLRKSLEIYRNEHKNFPARVVVHKSSVHNTEELDGFTQAMRDFHVEPELADFVSVTRSQTRLFRGGRYPPLRGTFFDTGGNLFVFYTKGSVDFFSAYPGLYIPHPLGFRCDKTAETPTFIAHEILALTKMNWNNTQFDGGQPITLRAARQVGGILKYLDDDYEPYYRYYM